MSFTKSYTLMRNGRQVEITATKSVKSGRVWHIYLGDLKIGRIDKEKNGSWVGKTTDGQIFSGTTIERIATDMFYKGGG